ncbi:hypothetical protein BDV95DRAFT_508650 [Massariosphaeria phaeospora]|uniref:Six-hairpin glycosidase-like protein n=1 Tax=Massariosphaeria phaeospora TaxID=100035 RepID=A0A7C8M116_9PLEO|nr:hypothetical protein BDV95DRAFT_508650 [Massariosphaeria phaeospora]
MFRKTLGFLLALAGYAGHAASQNLRSRSGSVTVRWIDGAPGHGSGVTFGLPWARGQHLANATTFTALAGNGDPIEHQSWTTAYWPDGTVKWTAHALAASDTVHDRYNILATSSSDTNSSGSNRHATNTTGSLRIIESSNEVTVDTGKIIASFPKSGHALISSIKTSDGKVIGKNGRLILSSQSGVVGDRDNGHPSDVKFFKFVSKIYNTTVSHEGPVRAIVTVQGIHREAGNTTVSHSDWLPFTVRFYLYSKSQTIRTIHTIVYDGDAETDFISGLGIRFDVPLTGEELYDRHIRIAGVDGGILHEAVQGLTGLRRDPGKEARFAQYSGTRVPSKDRLPSNVAGRLQWIPSWNDYRLTQLSPDGFNIQKRTKAGQSWLKMPGGTRAGGLVYLGGATVGGLALGLRDFWKKYPTSLDVTNAITEEGSVTLWIYSPAAEPLDVRPYHDGLGQDTYDKQLDALEITYEDYEEGFNTPYGVARTNEIYIYGFETTPSADQLSSMTSYINEPPVLIAEPGYIQGTRALGSYWTPPDVTSKSALAKTIEAHLDFLVNFYMNQTEQRRWYGFWDHGDIQHSYDVDRHTWKYDIGGFAWDNSELSPDLFFWSLFLRTGRADIYRLAEAQARHGSEVDMYHLGNFTGLGTRHGVQHWSDSAKQARISTPVYRKAFFYLSGGDERTGHLIHTALEAEKAFVLVDARRKVRNPSIVYKPDPAALFLNFGTDWAGVAAAYLLEWERRGPRWEEARDKLIETTKTFPKLKHGFITGEALYNSHTGAWSPPPTDPGNLGTVSVSHLSAVFGVLETIDELIEHYADIPQDFVGAWLDYCYYYSASKAEQKARYGKDFGNLSLRQGHSRLTAYAANKRKNATLAARAWKEFLEDNSADELGPDDPWVTVRVNGSRVLVPVDEAAWVTTNAAALYGLAAIENLALIGSPDGAINSTIG